MRCKGQGGSLDQQCYVVHEKEKSREKDAKAKAQLDKAKLNYVVSYGTLSIILPIPDMVFNFEKRNVLYTLTTYIDSMKAYIKWPT